MKKASLAVTAAFILFLGCKQQGTSYDNTSSNAAGNASATVAESKLTPEELGELGAKIKKDPKQADQILSQHGLDQQSFEHAVRKVAESPDQSKRYAAAYKKAS